MSPAISIAIDGPAGAGKSTVSRLLAEQLGYHQIDTGAMYRAITWMYLERGLDLENIQLSQFEYRVENGGTPRFLLNGEEITQAIRSAPVTSAVSRVSAHSTVRAFAVEIQRKLAQQSLSAGFGVVLEGRDIGSVVLPNAELKVFLTASVQMRARRRAIEENRPVAELEIEIESRDAADTSRSDSPLTIAADAVLLDTSDLNQAEVVLRLIELAHQAGA